MNTKGSDANYIPTFNIKLAAGRNFRPSDTLTEFVVNKTVVRKLNIHSDLDILNKRINVDGRVARVVGVVRNFHTDSFHKDIQPVCMMSNAPKRWCS